MLMLHYKQLRLWIGFAVCVFLLAFAVVCSAAEEVQVEINQNVWIPLFNASNNFDAEGFLSVQSKDLVRVSVDSKEIYGLNRYEREIREGFQTAKERGIARKSDVRFLERTTSESLAYETGYFRSSVTLPNGEVRTRYSRFEFVLRKENGNWRILVDKDTAEGGKITEEQYLAATPMK